MSKSQTGAGDFVMGTNAIINTPVVKSPSITGGTMTGATQSNTTLSGTTTNTGTISGGSSSGMTHTNATLSGTTSNTGTISGGSVSGAAVSGGSVSGAAVTGGTINNTVIGATTQANGNFVTVNAEALVVTPNNVDLSQAGGIYLGGQTGGAHGYPAANFPGTTLVHIPIHLQSGGVWYPAWLVASW